MVAACIFPHAFSRASNARILTKPRYSRPYTGGWGWWTSGFFIAMTITTTAAAAAAALVTRITV
jgi:hypothetical protein